MVAGLYAWKFSLPVNGFITECTPALTVDTGGKAQVLDSLIPLELCNNGVEVILASVEDFE